MAKEYIERDDAIYVINCTNTFTFSRERTIEKLRAILAADVVDVVRCKDCLRWKRDAYGGVCDRYGVRLDGDWFCAGGEKKEVQHDD